MGRISAVSLKTPSRASPLPLGWVVITKSSNASVHCGSGLAREEASIDTADSGQKKPPSNPLRMGDAVG
ncbi:hypothetical protein PHLH6_09970 [Pseudomonas sp. Seg1]|nr:hypothetical protein PHLH6_09970 [Pseudomonas sp. Seg1]